MVKTILDLSRQLFPLRNCRHNLLEENIKAEKFKVCLEYHLGNCKAPCVGLQAEDEYLDSIEQIKDILKGNIKQVSIFLKSLMKKYSEDFKFEEAQVIKEKLELLERYRSKSTVVNPRIINLDVFSIIDEEDIAFVNYLKVIEGAVVQAHTVELKKRMNESIEELLAIAIVDIRQKVNSDAKEILVPVSINLPIEHVKFIVPKKGDRKHLLDLSLRNAKQYKLERSTRIDNSSQALKPARILNAIKSDLRLNQLPVHIEGFDNSNIQGDNPVAACVVFRDAKPSKKDYRHYKVKTVTGPDDFASMEEIVFRRYKRLLDEEKGLPQLIVIDGGKGQLNAAVKSLDKLELRGKVAIVGVAKRLEEIYFPGDKVPLYIDKNSETLKVIQNIRNEAHRFGISFHRKLREKSMTGSELDQVPGIGVKTREALLKHFGSTGKIKTADFEELAGVVGKARAKFIRDYFLRSTT